MADYVIRVKDSIDKGVISKLEQIASRSDDANRAMTGLTNKAALFADVVAALNLRLKPLQKAISGIGRSSTTARSNIEALTVAAGGMSRAAAQASSSLNKLQHESLEAGVAISLLRVEAEKLSKVLLPMAKMGDVFKGAKTTANNLKLIMGAQTQASKHSQVATSRINALQIAIERMGAKSSEAAPKVSSLANALLSAGVAAEMYGKETKQLGPVLRDLLKNNGLLVTAKKRLSKQTSQLARDLTKYTSANSKAAMEQAKLTREMQRVQQGAARTTSALSRANSQIDALKTKSQGAMGGIRRLAHNLAAFFAIGLSGNQIVGMADSYTILQNKLSNVAKDQANLNKITEESFAVATRARVPVDDVAKSFSRFDLAIRGLGRSQKDVMGITETITKSLILGGATTSEASAGLLQLSQAFNKGKLDGDEFRSMMELMPAAADAIAKQMKVTRGDLLNLAPQGKITAEVMVKAFEAMAAEIEAKFAKMVPTIGQSLVVLVAKAMKAWGEFDKAHRITERLARSILALGNNIHIIVPIIGGLGAALSGVFAAKVVIAIGGMVTSIQKFAASLPVVMMGVQKLKVAFTALLATMGLHPFVAIAAAVVGASVALVGFSSSIMIGEKGVISLRDYGVAAFQLIGEAAKRFIDWIAPTWHEFVVAMGMAWEIFKTLSGAAFSWVLGIIKKFVNGAIGLMNGAVGAIGLAWNNLPIAVGAVFEVIYDMGEFVVEKLVNLFIKAFNFIGEKATALGKKMGLDLQFESFQNFQFEQSSSGSDITKKQDNLSFMRDVAGEFSKAMNTDYVGGILKDVGWSIDALAGIGGDIHKAVMKRANDNLYTKNRGAQDTYYEQSRPVVPNTTGGSNVDKADKAAQRAQKLIDRNTAGDGSDPLRKKYVDALKSMIGVRTAAEACADTVRDAAKKVDLEFGVTRRAIDDQVYGRREAGSFFGTDVSEIKKKSQVKPGDLVAIKKTYGNFGDDITHVATISKILEDGQLQIIDNAGRIIQERLLTAHEKANIVGYATPKALLKYTKRGGDTPEEAHKKQAVKDNEAYGKIVGKNALEIANEIVQLKMLSSEREKQEMFDKVEQQLYAKKLNWRGKDAELTRKQIDLLVEARKMQSAYDTIYQNSNSNQLNELDVQLRANKKAFDDGVISIQDYNREKYNLNETILNLMDPIREMNKQYMEEDYLLSIAIDKREAEAIVLEKVKNLKKEGIDIDKAAIDILRKEIQSRIEYNTALDRQNQLLEKAKASKVETPNKIADIDALLKAGGGYTEGDAARDVTDILGGMGLNTENFETALKAERDLFEQHLNELDALKQKGLISDAEYYSAKVQFQLKSQEKSLNFASQFFGNMASLSQSNNKTLFRVGKAAAIAGALVDTYRGAAAAIAEFPGPMGIALAASTVVAGLANVAQIQAQQMPGYKAGGYTGNMPTNKVAGVVHGREFVMNASATQRIGVGNLQALQNGSSIQGAPEPRNNPPQEQPAPIVNTNVNVAAVLREEDIFAIMGSKGGDTIVLDVIGRHKSSVSRTLGR